MTLGRSSKHLAHTLKNLASSLIQYDHIVTTAAKAKLTQNYVENLITKTKQSNNLKSFEGLLHGKLYNQEITIPKLTKDLRERYLNRPGGFCRILKLEPRVGDNSPQVILELVDNNDREIKFWLMAKIVARLQLQNLEMDKLTAKNVSDLIKFRKNGQEEFDNLVELCKKEFFNSGKEEKADNKIQNKNEDTSDNKNIDLKPRMKIQSNGFNKQFTNFVTIPREKQIEKETK